MEQHYIGSTPWRLGSTTISIVHHEEYNLNQHWSELNKGRYMKFVIKDTMFGMEWNKITFILTPEEYFNLLNKKVYSLLLTTDINAKTIHQINYLHLKAKDGKLTDIDISYTDYKEGGFFSSFISDSINISGRNLILTKEQPLLILFESID